MHLVMNPTQFDVLLLPNLYGDIVSDFVRRPGRRARCRAVGEPGRRDRRCSKPCTAAPLTSREKTCKPDGACLSQLLMLRHIGEGAMADRIMTALGAVLSEGKVRTRDLGGTAAPGNLPTRSASG
jgi:isocitrate dehydrogenase (NAD+)